MVYDKVRDSDINMQLHQAELTPVKFTQGTTLLQAELTLTIITSRSFAPDLYHKNNMADLKTKVLHQGYS